MNVRAKAPGQRLTVMPLATILPPLFRASRPGEAAALTVIAVPGVTVHEVPFTETYPREHDRANATSLAPGRHAKSNIPDIDAIRDRRIMFILLGNSRED